MRQRVMIAIALACAPRLLMADEPTTGLDVTVQAQILDLLATLQRDRQMGMILVTHDLGVVATRTDEIIVMYAGNVVERAPTDVLFSQMAMPYTEALLRSTPRIANPSHTRLLTIEGRPPDLSRLPRLPLRAPVPVRPGQVPRGRSPPHPKPVARPQLRLLVPAGNRHPHRRQVGWREQRRNGAPGAAVRRPLVRRCTGCRSERHGRPAAGRRRPLRLLHQGHGTVQAVAGISFGIFQGETLGLVGESGCGKSTTGRAIVQVEKPTSGKITFDGTSSCPHWTATTSARCAPRCR